MNTNQNPVVPTNNIIKFDFSIFGISGFKAVVAEGASPRRRMVSAINHIDRALNVIKKQSDSDTVPDVAVIDRALSLISTIKDSHFRIQNDAELPVQFVEKLEVMSTDKFLAVAVDVYKDSVSLFLTHLEKLEDNARAFYEARRNANKADVGATSARDYLPYLYECTGGIFGEEKFYFIFSDSGAAQYGSDAVEAIQNICREEIVSVKSFSLSDYIRATMNTEGVKNRILLADQELASVGSIKVTRLSPLLKQLSQVAARARIRDKGENIYPKLARTLESESRALLREYITEKIMPNHKPEDLLVP